MHIPDGFLSAPVWAGMAVVAAPAVGYAARRARETMDERRVPLLGVMGAFIFAAQMINFPVGIGTSGHLVGGALLAMTVGPAAAAVGMTAIVAVQALVFQDGGLLALGANVFNMAIVGVAAGYLPYRLFGGRWGGSLAIFLGAFFSVAAGAAMALTELWASGVSLPGMALKISAGMFAAAATAEGLITVLVVHAIKGNNPEWVRKPGEASSRKLTAIAIGALVLVAVGLFASTSPDVLQALAQQTGLLEQASIATPFSGYETSWLSGTWLRQATAGVVGLCLVFVLSTSAARLLKGARRN